MNPGQSSLIFALRIYRWFFSPAKTLLFGPLGRCRFTPSCSAYAIEAVRVHGAFFGAWLAMNRLCRCHPWGGCGCDFVPPVNARREPGRVTHQASTARPGRALEYLRRDEYQGST